MSLLLFAEEYVAVLAEVVVADEDEEEVAEIVDVVPAEEPYVPILVAALERYPEASSATGVIVAAECWRWL